MEQIKIVYKLYALDMKQENVAIAYRERFSRVAPWYVLIYTNGDAPKDGIELTDTKRLSDEDEQWLLDCNTIILAEETEKRKPEILKELNERIETLESVLKEKAEADNGGSEERA